LTPADETEALRAVRSAALLRQGMVLHGLGILPSRDTVRYTVLTDDGRLEVLQISASPNTDAAESGWVQAVETPPLWLQRPADAFWCKYLEEFRTGYCAFRSYKDLKDTSRVLRDLLAQHPENLVIDLRLNSGGDFTLGLKYVVEPIRKVKALNRKGHLFVLIGPKTFSAAMSNAAHFRERTNALLVGEPVGEKPNSYQEARDMILPNSHWDVRYSVKFYRFASCAENLIRPDRQVSETWDAYREGRDPVLEWVLHSISSQNRLPSASVIRRRAGADTLVLAHFRRQLFEYVAAGLGVPVRSAAGAVRLSIRFAGGLRGGGGRGRGGCGSGAMRRTGQAGTRLPARSGNCV
jgi:hypothetical protein